MKSEADARASYVFAAVIKLVFPVLLVLPGLLATRALSPMSWARPARATTPTACCR